MLKKFTWKLGQHFEGFSIGIFNHDTGACFQIMSSSISGNIFQTHSLVKLVECSMWRQIGCLHWRNGKNVSVLFSKQKNPENIQCWKITQQLKVDLYVYIYKKYISMLSTNFFSARGGGGAEKKFVESIDIWLIYSIFYVY